MCFYPETAFYTRKESMRQRHDEDGMRRPVIQAATT